MRSREVKTRFARRWNKRRMSQEHEPRAFNGQPLDQTRCEKTREAGDKNGFV